MNTHIYLLLFTVLCVSCSQLKTGLINNEQTKFLNKIQTETLFQNIIDDIEKYDAEMITTRNNNKDISWNNYKEYHQKKWKKETTSEELKKMFFSFSTGFVNAHSRFKFLYTSKEGQKSRQKEYYKSDIKIGYTYPEISFFDLESNETIVKINDTPIEDIYWHFKNYETKTIGENDVLDSFKFHFENHYLKIKDNIPISITYKNGQKKKITYHKLLERKKSTRNTRIDVSDYKDWKIIRHGYKTALLQKDSIALIKIKNFKYPNGRGDGIACQNIATTDSTMCKDVRILKEGLKSISQNINYLIFDLQGNHGGKENTPFLKMFSPAPFYDLRVQYKKTSLLLDPNIREALSYYNTNGENWFKTINKNGVFDKTLDGDFLPVRADFCRGDSNCKLVKQQPNDSLTSKFSKIIILVNEGTASSADDFVFRFKKNKNVLLAGQPQSADLTYALITVLYYIDDSGKIQRVYFGNAQQEPQINGVKLFKLDIPYSKTVNIHGEMLQGNPIPLDLLIPITKENFTTKELDVLNEVTNKLCN